MKFKMGHDLLVTRSTQLYIYEETRNHKADVVFEFRPLVQNGLLGSLIFPNPALHAPNRIPKLTCDKVKKLLNRLNLRKKVPKMSRQVDVQKIRANYRKLRGHKVVLDGVYGVGKTSLFKRMFNLGFSEEKTALPKWSISTHEEILDEEETIIPLVIWDTADFEEYESIAQSYYRNSTFVLLVYNADDEYSMHRLFGLAHDVKAYEPSAKLILVKNKIDLPVSSDTIPEEKEKAFRRSMEKEFEVIAHFSTSAKTPKGVDELLKELAKYSLKLFVEKQRHFVDSFRLHEVNQRNKTGHSCCS